MNSKILKRTTKNNHKRKFSELMFQLYFRITTSCKNVASKIILNKCWIKWNYLILIVYGMKSVINLCVFEMGFNENCYTVHVQYAKK